MLLRRGGALLLAPAVLARPAPIGASGGPGRMADLAGWGAADEAAWEAMIGFAPPAYRDEAAGCRGCLPLRQTLACALASLALGCIFLWCAVFSRDAPEDEERPCAAAGDCHCHGRGLDGDCDWLPRYDSVVVGCAPGPPDNGSGQEGGRLGHTKE